MSIKNNKNICLVYIYGNIRRQKITLLYMYVFYSRNYNIICLMLSHFNRAGTPQVITFLLQCYYVYTNTPVCFTLSYIIELCCPQQLGKLF